MKDWVIDKVAALGVLLLLVVGTWLVAQGLIGLGYVVAPGIADYGADAKPIEPPSWR